MPQQIMPYSETAEKAVLRSVLINPRIGQELVIKPDDFYIYKNRQIWEAYISLIAQGINPDAVTLHDELERRGVISEVGGEDYLFDLVGGESNWVNVMEYACIIHDYGRRRRAIQAASDLAVLAFSTSKDFDTGLEEIIQRITMDVSTRKGATPISGMVSDLIDEILILVDKPKDTIWGLQTGIIDYDRATGGIQDADGEMVYIAGEPGVGKSILTAQIGVHLAMQGYPGAIYSLEMKNRQVLRRIISALARIETRKLKTGRLSQLELASIIQASEKAAALNMHICDESSLTTNELRSDIARLKARHGIRWFVLDYMYLMADTGSLDDTERTGALSRALKQICKDFEVGGITVNSVTKRGMDGSALRKSDVRGSGQVIHDADVVLFMQDHQPRQFETKNPNIKTLTFGKGRELDQPNLAFNLLKHDGYPLFENMVKP